MYIYFLKRKEKPHTYIQELKMKRNMTPILSLKRQYLLEVTPDSEIMFMFLFLDLSNWHYLFTSMETEELANRIFISYKSHSLQNNFYFPLL